MRAIWRSLSLGCRLKKGNPEMIQLLRDYGAFSPRSLRITNQLRAAEELPPLVITSRTGRVYQ